MSRFSLSLQVDLERRGHPAGPGAFALSVEAAWDAPACALFGPSGAGKSTLLEALCGLRPARGRIELDGRVLLDTTRGVSLPAQQRKLGWVPQDASLFPHLTAGGNVLFGAPRGTGRDALEPLLSALEIGALWDRPAPALSGGERQRVAMARALASGARMLLLDEPLAALDLPLRARVAPLLLRVRDELGVPMLYVSHDPQELLGVAEHAIRLEGGRVVQHGPIREVLWAAAGALRGALLRNNRLAGVVASGSEPGLLRVLLDGGGELWVAGALPLGARALVEFRAEEVLLAAREPGLLSAQNQLRAKVVSLTPDDGAVLVHLSAPQPITAQVTTRAAETLGLCEGREVWAVLKAHACRALRP